VRPAKARIVKGTDVPGWEDRPAPGYIMAADLDVVVRKGDAVLGRRAVNNPPGTILISSTGLGVVLLDLYGFNFTVASGKNPALTVLSRNGTPRYSKSLHDLFDGETRVNFPRTGSGTFWLDHAWIDEQRKEIVIVGRKDGRQGTPPLAVVGFEKGSVRSGGVQDVLQAISSRNRGALKSALEVAMRMNLKQARRHLPGILSDRALPLDARLRAAVFLSRLGDKSGAKLLVRAARTASHGLLEHPDWEDLEFERYFDLYDYSVKHLPELLGARALPVLSEVARRVDYPVVAAQAFSRLGRAAVPTLVAMLADETDPNGQLFAAGVLEKIKPPTRRGVAALTRALRSSSRSPRSWLDLTLRGVAAEVLGEMGPAAKSALPSLSRLLHDDNEDVRTAAAEAIRKIKRERVD
jgi:hypothetical protein